jgi:hypothetical protein
MPQAVGSEAYCAPRPATLVPKKAFNLILYTVFLLVKMFGSVLSDESSAGQR